MNRYIQIIAWVLAAVVLAFGLVWLSSQNESGTELRTEHIGDESFKAPLLQEEQAVVTPQNVNSMNTIATITTNYGDITVELFNDTMPVTAGNFEKLAREGFYNNVKFHRVIDGFMVQAGDPNTKTDNVATWGTGGPGYAIPDEHVAGELLTNTRGTLSMANSGPQSGGSQFFINLVDNTFLDFDKEPLQSKHPVFGRVIEGMEVVDKIAKVEVAADGSSRPVEPVVIESIAVKEGGE